ncbi:hypothetical protein [uncultured Ruegeria sp.]|uniref:hypothetical protein n=1 Tax=uncultured Ruegeria sp. TaxID=259304 RepID=UPI002627E221|nr:hypothetical protein [uncultured Ruegeria sp.]
MLRILIISVACAAAVNTAHAEEDSSKSLMEQGAELFLEGLRQEMEPAIKDLRGFAEQFGPALQSFMQEMGPALAELAAQVQDWSAYEVPEMLPNGDIIIRKKPFHERPDNSSPQGDAPSDGQTDI